MIGPDIVFTLLLTAAVEFVTVVLRLVVHLNSVHVQHKLHWPRTHHAYLGIALVLLAFLGWIPNLLSVRYAFILGAALIFSDIIHHVALIPLIRRFRYDVHMVHHSIAHRYLVRWSSALAIFIGAVVITMPFTTGSRLLPTIPGL